MVITRSTVREVLDGLVIHPYVLRKMRNAITESVRYNGERGFLIYGDLTTTEVVRGVDVIQNAKGITSSNPITKGINLGHQPNVLASYHTHPDGDLMYSAEDAITMMRNNEPVMIIGGPYWDWDRSRYKGHAISIYTPNTEGPFQEVQEIARNVPDNSTDYISLITRIATLRRQRQLFDRLVVSLQESSMKNPTNMKVLYEDHF